MGGSQHRAVRRQRTLFAFGMTWKQELRWHWRFVGSCVRVPGTARVRSGHDGPSAALQRAHHVVHPAGVLYGVDLGGKGLPGGRNVLALGGGVRQAAKDGARGRRPTHRRLLDGFGRRLPQIGRTGRGEDRRD